MSRLSRGRRVLVPRLVVKCSGKIEPEASELDFQMTSGCTIEYKYRQQITSSFSVLGAKLTFTHRPSNLSILTGFPQHPSNHMNKLPLLISSDLYHGHSLHLLISSKEFVRLSMSCRRIWTLRCHSNPSQKDPDSHKGWKAITSPTTMLHLW